MIQSLILLLFSVHSAQAATPFCSGATRACPPLTSVEKIAVDSCAIEFKANRCDRLVAAQPDLKDRMKNCTRSILCPAPTGISDYGKTCYSALKESWSDTLKGLAAFVFGNQSLSDSLKAREAFFASCTTAACKREMLGPYSRWFSKEEIEGRAEDAAAEDSASQNARNGFSAAVLYRKLLLRLKEKAERGEMIEPFIQPWDGKAARPPQSLNAAIENWLTRMGIENTKCFDPQVVMEARCYAFFAVLDPTLAGAAAFKAASLFGQAAKGAKTVAALATKPTAAERLSKLTVRYENTAELPKDVAKGIFWDRKNGSYLLTEKIPPGALPYSTSLRRPRASLDASYTSLDKIPHAKVKETTNTNLASRVHGGGSSLVRLAYLSDGTPVALKTKLAQDEVLTEARSAEFLSSLGIGPRFRGIYKDAAGRTSLAMDVVPGDLITRAGDKVKTAVTRQTLNDLETIIQRLTSAGVTDFDEMQLYLTPNHRLMAIDPGDVIEQLHAGAKASADAADDLRMEIVRHASPSVQESYLAELRKSDPPLAERLADLLQK